jgi:hypothetical protein
MAARREPPIGSFLPERSTRRPVWGRIDGLAERDGKIGQRQFRPIGRHGKLEPVWIRDCVSVRKPIGDAGRSQLGAAERRARYLWTVAKLPRGATQPGAGTGLPGVAVSVSGAALFGARATVLGAHAAIFSSGAAILGSGAEVFGSGAVSAAHVRTQLWRRWRA